MGEAPRGTSVTIALLWLSVAGIAVYWLTFFSNVSTANWDRCYVVFERAFPPADAVLAFSAAAAAVALQRRRGSAVTWGLFAAGQFCFLGLLGAAYNLEHGGYDFSLAMLAELWVNAFCLSIAAWLMAFLARHRRTLEGS
jgi:hypothetical protein